MQYSNFTIVIIYHTKFSNHGMFLTRISHEYAKSSFLTRYRRLQNIGLYIDRCIPCMRLYSNTRTNLEWPWWIFLCKLVTLFRISRYVYWLHNLPCAVVVLAISFRRNGTFLFYVIIFQTKAQRSRIFSILLYSKLLIWNVLRSIIYSMRHVVVERIIFALESKYKWQLKPPMDNIVRWCFPLLTAKQKR